MIFSCAKQKKTYTPSEKEKREAKLPKEVQHFTSFSLQKMLKFQTLDAQLIHQAEAFFPQSYKETLLSKPNYEASLCGRFLITQYFQSEKGEQFFPPEGIYDHSGLYYSLSHKNNHLLLGISSKKIGVDVEILKPRDQGLLGLYIDDLNFLGGVSRENFYTLWVARESLVKIFSLPLDQMEEFKLFSVSEVLHEKDGLFFSQQLVFSYQDEILTIYVGREGELVFAYGER